VVVGVSSIGARISNPLLGMYHASKYALTAFHEALAVEVAPFGIRVVTIEPGMVATEFPKATTPTGSVTDPEGPYAPLLAELRAGFGQWRERHGVGAEEVAAAVVAAIADPAAPFRVEVGEDTRILAGARERLDDREFHSELLEFLGVRAWPDGGGSSGT
jgi:NAD(P)-dependent dehydrogenase (short-subunit alcohol dehydrogenase family)